MGYEGVEPHDLFGHDPRAVRKLLDELGLAVTSRHAGLDAIEARLDELADELGELGSDRLVLSWIAPPRSAAEAERAVQRICAVAERARAAGLRFGFHNHDGELRPLEDGRTVLDRLLDLDDELLFLEVDLGWAWFAGIEPEHLMERLGPRVPLVHGDVGYPDVLPAIRDLGAEWLLVEQDEAEGSALDAARRSFAAVVAMVGSPA
jgi:sugar phosphate isomerase/epimerase